MKKLVAEAFGTAVLVLVGCGSVALAGYGNVMPLGILPIALAFGLSVTAMAYGIGPVSGCHINPAVTMAMVTSGRMSVGEAGPYMAAQVVGAFLGSTVLIIIVGGSPGAAFGQTTYDAAKYGVLGAFVTEFVATLIFTIVILGVTQAKAGSGNIAGLVIGLTLALLHLAFVPVTGNSLNPARSLAPAVFVGGTALAQVWLYILAPLAGGAVAGLLFKSGTLSSE